MLHEKINYKNKIKSYHKIYNLGNNNTEDLLKFIKIIEKNLGINSKKNFLPIQPGDVPETFADITQSKKDLNFNPKTKIQQGIPLFIKWYKDYYNI